MLRKPTALTVLVYGLVLILLGYLGYALGGSKISLYSGGGFGILMLLSAAGIFKKKKWAFYSALTLTLMLIIVFAIRYLSSSKNLPGALALISAGVFIYLICQIFDKEETF